MRIITYSDLHLEFGSGWMLPPAVNGDVMILAGDIVALRDYEPLDQILRKWKKPVLYVTGNHEYYTRRPMNEEDNRFKAWLEGRHSQVKLLLDEEVSIGGVNFFGGTMWTDFNGGDLRAMETACSQMNDYRLIYNPDETPFTPADSIALHKNFASKLLNWFGKNLSGPRVLSITDANNHITQFAYNARGWVTQTTFPSTLMESYNYDLVGNLQSKTDRKNQTIQYVYDALYRLSSKSYPDQTSVEYAYDLAGKVQQVSDPTGTYGFAYDNMGRLIGTTTQYSYLPGVNFQNAYTYDAASNRKSLTAPDGSISTYGYDTLNRLNGLANSWAGSFGFGYDALSRRTQLTRPNGITTNYNYDSLSHLLSVLHQAGTNTLDGASYTYDPAGNRTSKGNYLNGVTSNYTYDPLYELTQVTQGGSTTETYSYDFVGNRLSSTGVPNYNYNSSNELTSNSSGSYTYDANGNTLTDASGRSFTWDFENRLTQAVVPGTNGGTTTFKYDPFGRRIQKSGPLGTTNYLYDRASLMDEIDNSGTVLARYTQGRSVDEPLAQLRSGTTSFYDQDGIGSVTSLSNSVGALIQTYAYDSFGKPTASTGTLVSPFQYTGRELDSETGIYYYRARYFDPNAGRFLSEDRLRFGADANFYRYAGNNSLNWIDPSGNGRTCWSVRANGTTQVPCSGECIRTSTGYSCSVPMPPDPAIPPAPPTPPVPNPNTCAIEKANTAFEHCVGEKALSGIGKGLIEAIDDASKDKEAPSSTDVIVNVANAALDVQKECLAENPLADLSPNYHGLFNSGDTGVYPIIGGIFSF